MTTPVTPEAAAAAALLGPEPDGIPVPPGAGPTLQPTLFELSRPGRGGGKVPHPPKDALDRIPAAARRASPPALPEVDEPTLARHYVNLSRLNYSIDTGFYPLGSCTMKFNPKVNEWAARLPGFAGLHPFAPDIVAQGTLEMLWQLERGPRRDLGDGRGDAPAGRGRPGRAGRDPHDPRIPPLPRRRRPDRGRHPGQRARHEPRHRVDGRLHDRVDPVRPGRRRGHRGVPGGAGATDRRDHDHQPVDARALREADRRAAGHGPRDRRARLHGRRKPQRDHGPLPARGRRVRRHALQRPQDVQHAPRRRRTGRRARSASGPPSRRSSRRRA